MKNRKLHFFSAVLLTLICLQSPLYPQAPAPAATPTPETVAVEKPSETSKIDSDAKPPEIPKTDSDSIHLGDLIDVDVIGSVEYDWRGKLNPEGFLDGIDYAENPIYALCRREDEIAAEIAAAYAKILREPKVVVKILDRSNRPQTVLYGAVKTPQRFQIRRPFHLNELIVIAGGLTERASGEIQIFRQKNLSCRSPSGDSSGGTVADADKNREKYLKTSQDNGSGYINIRISDLLTGKKEANPQILSGDIVTILEAEAIYVIGGVANPKQISSRTQTTLSRAIAAAGGIARKADPKKITIYRRAAGETQTIEADLERIKAGESEDVVLRAFDIVEVEQAGREKRKFPPVLQIAETGEKKNSNLPLRIID